MGRRRSRLSLGLGEGGGGGGCVCGFGACRAGASGRFFWAGVSVGTGLREVQDAGWLILRAFRNALGLVYTRFVSWTCRKGGLT